MTTYNSHSDVLKIVESISNKKTCYTNEGLVINLTSNEAEESTSIVTKLKSVFSKVKVTGRKYKKIHIYFVSEKIVNGHRILEVTY